MFGAGRPDTSTQGCAARHHDLLAFIRAQHSRHAGQTSGPAGFTRGRYRTEVFMKMVVIDFQDPGPTFSNSLATLMQAIS
jgi:hypothetical protein